ncbi:DUF6285 domain-containing protein [Mycolicibacterium lacusdiani]|uniref:DUF6285 domain-containing protein n=1 Tax=Mycolicibacterium lacusdiani TaxID=2895283 RepID=UPI001F402E87|nr:DUF6285 domain-containing protein [Mycolicibacterium lacusdiani]
MTGLHGRPTAAELVAAVAEFLDTEVRGKSTAPDGRLAGAVDFHARVAANALRIVERELLDTAPDPDFLGHGDERALAAAIRSGELDDRPADVLPVLRTLVMRRLAVAHPGYEDE